MAGGFDPEAYLAKKTRRPSGAAELADAPGFDPAAYLKTKRTPRVEADETFVANAVDQIPLGDALVDAATAGIVEGDLALRGEPARLTPEAIAEMERLGIAVPNQTRPSAMDRFRAVRDIRKERAEAGTEQNPTAAMAGDILGVGASLAMPSPVFKAKKPGSLASRLRAAGKTGAAYGALSGLTEGEADVAGGEWGKAMVDVGAGAAAGAGLGPLVGVGAEGVAKLLAGPAERVGINAGRRHLLNGADSLSSREPVSDAAVREAVESGAIRPFANTKATYQRLIQESDRVGAAYGELVAKLEKRGVQGPAAKEVAYRLLGEAIDLAPNTMNEALPAEYLKQATAMLTKSPKGGPLGLTQAESLKRSLQEQARYGRIEETPLNRIRRKSASIVREANEEAIESAASRAGSESEIAQMAEYFRPLKKRFGALAEAEAAAERGAARSAQRSQFGLTDYLAGSAAATVDPTAGVATGVLNNALRNRLPSAVATDALGLSNALRRGTAGAAGSRVAGQQAGMSENKRRVRPIISVATGKVLGYEEAPERPEEEPETATSPLRRMAR